MIGAARYRFGAESTQNGANFRLFAPAARAVAVVVRDGGEEREIALESRGGGWFEVDVRTARPGARYAYRIDGADRLVPDPASRFQPEGVHGMSELIDPRTFVRADGPWRGRPWPEMVFYELHVGTFTPGGTYASASERLDDLAALGVTAIELMPLAQWPGTRNWGYDGVLPYAPAERYGRPEDLVRLIDEAHRRELAVYLDVVYNHFGPEGNYLHGYAPQFFTAAYRTPWGDAIDFSHDDVRAFFIENACWWLEAYGFDGLRLDATQTIFDTRAPHVLAELRAAATAAAPQRTIGLVVENDRNDVRLLRAGFDAQWNDDAHHAMHVLTTGDVHGYYADFATRPAWLLARALSSGYAYQGEPSTFHGGVPRGARSADLPLARFIDFLQNHDQIGNRAKGERLSMLAPPEAVRAASAVLLLAPSPPLLFMGEEWAASTPFLFFCDFEPALGKLVTDGRRREFSAFPDFADARAQAEIPDPVDVRTFERCILRWDEREREPHRSMLEHYRELLRLRREHIVPFVAGADGRRSASTAIGRGGVRATWTLPDATALHLEANLSAVPLDGFAGIAPGRRLYGPPAFDGGVAPPWSVRWSIG